MTLSSPLVDHGREAFPAVGKDVTGRRKVCHFSAVIAYLINK